MHEVALKAAERAVDITQSRASPGSLKQLLQQWLRDAAEFRSKHGARMVQECERLLQGYSQKQVGCSQACIGWAVKQMGVPLLAVLLYF